MRDLEEVLAELKAAEKEYAQKCAKYGIEETGKKKKTEASEENQEVVQNDNKAE